MRRITGKLETGDTPGFCRLQGQAIQFCIDFRRHCQQRHLGCQFPVAIEGR
ncbi:hypothetical protein D3C87_1881070 [compost metagenome]